MNLDLGNGKVEGVKSGTRKLKPTLLKTSSCCDNATSLDLPPAKVIKTIIMTKMEITTYPNGNRFYKSQTWEVGQERVARKAKKRTVKVKKVKSNKIEEY